MWGAIKGFFVKIFWPSTKKLIASLTPVIADTAVQLAKNKANELRGRTSKEERRRVERMLVDDLKKKGLKIGVDFTMGEIEDAAKLAIKKANGA
jgi:hypothetical protein